MSEVFLWSSKLFLCIFMNKTYLRISSYTIPFLSVMLMFKSQCTIHQVRACNLNIHLDLDTYPFLISTYLVKSLNGELSKAMKGPAHLPEQCFRVSCASSAPFSEFLDLAVILSICDLSWEAAFLLRDLNVDMRGRRVGWRWKCHIRITFEYDVYRKYW